MGIIYKVTNKINGKSYIGQTKFTLEKRKIEHEKHNDCYFHYALKKYGFENFKWETVEDKILKEKLNEKEKHYINEYNTFENGYNLTTGGEGGYIRSEETKKLLSEWASKRIGEKSSFYGKKHTEESKEKNRLKHLGKIMSEETKEKIQKKLKGRIPWNKGLTKEISKSLKNMSETKKGKLLSKETREKISETMKGRIFTEEHKQKIKISTLKRKRDKNGTFIGELKLCGN